MLCSSFSTPIAGLDPAGPLFANNDPLGTVPETRLNPSNAALVQCIHTNGEPLVEGGFGTMQPMGHVDFYANGGQVQPGCLPGFWGPIRDLTKFNCNYLQFPTNVCTPLQFQPFIEIPAFFSASIKCVYWFLHFNSSLSFTSFTGPVQHATSFNAL